MLLRVSFAADSFTGSFFTANSFTGVSFPVTASGMSMITVTVPCFIPVSTVLKLSKTDFICSGNAFVAISISPIGRASPCSIITAPRTQPPTKKASYPASFSIFSIIFCFNFLRLFNFIELPLFSFFRLIVSVLKHGFKQTIETFRM